jgi:hypothetical protein
VALARATSTDPVKEPGAGEKVMAATVPVMVYTAPTTAESVQSFITATALSVVEAATPTGPVYTAPVVADGSVPSVV